MFKRSFISLSAALFVAANFNAPAMADDDAAIAQALAALDAQLPGKLINNPYDVKWSSYGPDKKDSIVKSEGAPGGMAYKVTVKKKQKNHWDTAIRGSPLVKNGNSTMRQERLNAITPQIRPT